LISLRLTENRSTQAMGVLTDNQSAWEIWGGEAKVEWAWPQISWTRHPFV